MICNHRSGVRRIKFGILRCAFFLACGCVGYRHSITSFFLSDDFSLVQGVAEKGPFGILTFSPATFFRPVISLSFFADYCLGHWNPTGYHLTNIFFHSLNAVLILEITRILASSCALPLLRRSIAAYFAGFLFLFSPCHTEAVCWISGRMDVITTFFLLFSAYFYLLSLTEASCNRIVPAAIMFVFALFSKESAIILPLIFISLEFYQHRIAYKKLDTKRLCRRFLLFSFLFLVYCGTRRYMLGQFIGGYGMAVHTRFDLNQILPNFFLFTIRTLIPGHPNLSLTMILSVIVFASFPIILGRIWIKNDYPAMRSVMSLVAVWYIVSLLPVINLYLEMTNPMGERFIYLPSVFTAIIAGLTIGASHISSKRFTAFGSILILALFLSLDNGNQTWKAAGSISRSIVSGFEGIPSDKNLVIINMPDNLNGAYIFRNGFESALRVFQPRFRKITCHLASFYMLTDPADSFFIRYSNNARCIRPKTDRTFLFCLRPFPDIPLFHTSTISNPGENQVCLECSDSEPRYRVYYYSESKLITADQG
jgi:protein O-mannosyl-transferase